MHGIRCKTAKKSMTLIVLTAFLLVQILGLASTGNQVYALEAASEQAVSEQAVNGQAAGEQVASEKAETILPVTESVYAATEASDKKCLNSAISDAQKLYDQTDGASKEKKDALKSAIDSSKLILNDSAAAQQQVDDAVKMLYAAIKVYKDPKISFQVISDIHISTTDKTNNATAHFIKALKDIKTVNTTSQGIIVAGDITDTGEDSEYDAVNDILSQNDHPDMYYTMGNHDVRYMGPEAFDRFKSKTGMPGIYYDKWINGYHFIFLGSEQNLKDGAYISDEQFAWLDGKLKETDASQPVFIFMHQPMYGLLQGTARWKESDWVVQHVRLRKLLGQYPQSILFTGHTHYTLDTCFKYDEKYCTMFNTGGVYYLENAITYDEANGSQGLFVEVYDNKVVVKGREFTDGSWINGAEYTVSYPVKFPPVDNEKPRWTQNAAITASEIEGNKAVISWPAAEDAGTLKYNIYRDDVLIDTVKGDLNTYKLAALKPNTDYTVKITAVDEEENISDFLETKIKTTESINQKELEFIDVELRSNLKAYLSFDGNYEDLTNKNATKSEGKLEYVDGKRGKALRLNGSNYVSLGNMTYGQGSFTIAFWEKSSPPAEDTSFISNKDWDSGSNTGWIFGHGSNNRKSMWFNITSSGAKRHDIRDLPDSVIADNTWHYIAISVDRTKGEVNSYIDGKVVNASDISAQKGKSLDSGLPTVIGADGLGNFKVSADIDEVAILGKALTDVEVNRLMSTSLPAFEINSQFKVADEIYGKTVDQVITSLSGNTGKYVNAYIDVKNNLQTAKEFVIIAVSYDKSGAMLTSAANYKTINASEQATLEMGMLAAGDVDKIKVFVLDGTGFKGIYPGITYLPLSSPIILQKAG